MNRIPWRTAFLGGGLTVAAGALINIATNNLADVRAWLLIGLAVAGVTVATRFSHPASASSPDSRPGGPPGPHAGRRAPALVPLLRRRRRPLITALVAVVVLGGGGAIWTALPDGGSRDGGETRDTGGARDTAGLRALDTHSIAIDAAVAGRPSETSDTEIVEGRAYIAALAAGRIEVTAVDLTARRKLWRVHAGQFASAPPDSARMRVKAMPGGRVLVELGRTFVLDASDGHTLWEADGLTGMDIYGEAGIATTRGRRYGIDLGTGTRIWEQDTALSLFRNYRWPVEDKMDNDTDVYGMSGNVLYRFDPTTGARQRIGELSRDDSFHELHDGVLYTWDSSTGDADLTTLSAYDPARPQSRLWSLRVEQPNSVFGCASDAICLLSDSDRLKKLDRATGTHHYTSSLDKLSSIRIRGTSLLTSYGSNPRYNTVYDMSGPRKVAEFAGDSYFATDSTVVSWARASTKAPSPAPSKDQDELTRLTFTATDVATGTTRPLLTATADTAAIDVDNGWFAFYDGTQFVLHDVR
jgi:hypothetical protein